MPSSFFSSLLASRRLALLALAVGLLCLLLLYGKLVWLPLALVGPSGSSPPFLGAASYLPLRGDRVLYC
ncbi:MAG: hypothetical protein QXF57_00630, partial [Acidilobaceae archaeon]